MKPFNYIIIIIILLSSDLLLAQNKLPSEEDTEEYVRIVPPSPTAYELGKYGQIPVGYFTGTPNISVPLYNYKAGQLSVPITLSYNSNGIKVDEIETIVGLGWSLNIGGVITRIVRDDPDEDSYQFYPENEIHEAGTYSKMAMDYFISSTVDGMDSESDLYMFNFNGYVGKFVYDNNKKILLMPHQNLKIVAYCNNLNEINYEITSTDGIRYIFSEIEKTHYFRELTNTIDDLNVPVITAWYLTRIIHPSGDEIIFTYEPHEYAYSSSISQFHSKSYPYLGGCPGGESCGHKNNIATYKNNCHIFGARISQISSNNIIDGTIIIDYNQTHPDPAISNYDLISNIKVQTGEETLESFSFSYSATLNKRLFLSRVVFKDPSKYYAFEYIEPELLCERLTFSQDYWGYSNNKNNVYFVPEMDAGIFYDSPWSGDRKPDSVFARKGLLKKITYPTKGYHEFVYEANTYWGTKINYPPKKFLTLEAATDENIFHYTDTDTTGTINSDHEAFFHTGVLFNTEGSGCDQSVYQFDIKANVSVKNLNTNTYVEIYKFSDIIGWYLVSNPAVDIFEGDFSTYKINLEAGINYEVILKLMKPCLLANLTLEYYQQEIEEVDMNLETGGSRIRKIIAKDPFAGNENITTYYYNKYGALSKSSGDQGTKGYFMSKRINRIPCPVNCDFFDCEYFVLGSESQIQLNNGGNNNIYYEYVTVSHGGENFENGGETHQFIINRDVPGNPLINTGFAQNGACFTNIGWNNGLEKSVEIFKIVGDQKILLSNKTNFYTQDNRNKNESYSYSVMKNFNLICTRDHHYTCTSSDINKKWLRIKCDSDHNHHWFLPGNPFDGSDDPVCIAIGASNTTYWDYHPCYGRPVGYELVYPDMIENLNIIEYVNHSFWHYPDSTNIIEYDQNGGNPVTSYIKYYYDNKDHIQLTRTIKKDSKGKLIELHSWYPEDFDSIGNLRTLVEKHITSLPLKTEEYVDDKIINGHINQYDDFGMPVEIKAYENNLLLTIPTHDPSVITVIPEHYNKIVNLTYSTDKHRLIEKQPDNDIITCYIWGYHHTQIVAEVENATYAEVTSILECSIEDLQSKTDIQLRNIFNNLRTDLPGAMITSYTYKPLIGMTSETDPSGKTIFYNYDDFGRLETILDQNGNILKHMDYHYAGDERH